MQDNVRAGDIVIAQAAVRQDGTSREYAPIELPAVADFDITTALRAAAEENGYNYHIGTVQCKDSFYGQHNPGEMPIADELSFMWKSWKRCGVLASEMETAAVFTVSAVRKMKSGAVLQCIWNQDRPQDGEFHDTSRAIETAVEAVRRII
jgi:uridine phosphorylase